MLPGQVGLFAARGIRKGAIIAPASDFDERLVPFKAIQNVNPTTRKKIKAHCIAGENGIWMPSHYNLNRISIQWYMNHSCNPNVVFDHNEDFVARNNIAPGDELVWDFGTGFDHPRWRLECNCGEGNCRGVVTGSDWRLPELQIRYKGHFTRIIQKKINQLQQGIVS